MRIPKEIIEEIKYRCDVEDVISTYVTLSRAGSNKHGVCPFHSEKTPSFTVFPATKSFYCFGCGAGGDVVTFIQKIENLDYVDALEFLAAKAGISIPKDGVETGYTLTRRRVYEMNLEAAKFFRSCLFDPQIGRAAMDYFMGKRRLSPAVIKHFGLGYAPDDFGMLTAHMKRLGYTEEELVAAFLSRRAKTGKGVYDQFRNRVMFPVIDTTGNIVAFGGRVLDDSKPKYLNSSETPGFKKSRILFGLNYARHCAAEEMILCEGYMDTIAMHAAGFENAVATLGTAITAEHARLLARYTKRIVINYDSDEAGQKAANKAMQLLDEVGLDVRVLKLSDAKDADEYIHRFGAEAFRSLLHQSRTAFDFKLEDVLARHDITATEGKVRAARALAAIIAETASGVERELYINTAAKRLSVSADSLANDVKLVRGRMWREKKEKEKREVLLSARNFGDRINPDAAKNPAAAAAEDAVIGMMLLLPERRSDVFGGKVSLQEDDFFTDFGKRAFRAIREIEGEGEFSFSLLGQYFSPDEMGRLVRLQQDRQALSNNDSDVLRASASVLLEQKEKREARATGDLQGEIARLRAARKKKDE